MKNFEITVETHTINNAVKKIIFFVLATDIQNAIDVAKNCMNAMSTIAFMSNYAVASAVQKEWSENDD